MNDVLERLRGLAAWVDALALRERLLVFAAVLVALVVVWDAILMSPLDLSRTRVQDELEGELRRIQALGAELATLQAAARNDPNRLKREESERLQRRVEELDVRLAERTSDLIPPSRMTHVLKDLLRRHSGIRLVRLEALPVEALSPGNAAGLGGEPDQGLESAAGAALYKHGLRMELGGDYPSTLRYLEAIEQLPWQLLWDRLTYRVTEYPRASVEVVVYTLSTEEAWIGV